MDFILLDRAPITHSNFINIKDTMNKLEKFWYDGRDDISTEKKKQKKFFLDE